MPVSGIMEKMIAFSKGNIHDIDHFIRVWTYAKTIGEQEKLPPDTQLVLELAAITHDIACPLCREKYGSTLGRYQEEEGERMVREFLSGSGLTPEQIDRISYLVGHHHSPDKIEGMDYQILIEADFMANAWENSCSKEAVRNFMDTWLRTESGKRLIGALFCMDAQ